MNIRRPRLTFKHFFTPFLTLKHFRLHHFLELLLHHLKFKITFDGLFTFWFWHFDVSWLDGKFWHFYLTQNKTLPKLWLWPTLVSKKTTFRSNDVNRSSKLANRPEQLRWKVLRKSAIRVMEVAINWTYSRLAQSCWLFRWSTSRWYCKCLLLIFARSL